MRRVLTASLLAVPFLLAPACGSCPACEDEAATAELVTCAECGVEKGAEGCCDPEAPRCERCGKIEGSPGCCE